MPKNLTGGCSGDGQHVTDVTNASRTMLYNISTEKWDDKLLDFFGIPKHVLPQVKSSAEHYGNMVSLYVNRLFRRFDKIKRID